MFYISIHMCTVNKSTIAGSKRTNKIQCFVCDIFHVDQERRVAAVWSLVIVVATLLLLNVPAFQWYTLFVFTTFFVGSFVGSLVGSDVGSFVGSFEGCLVGSLVG